MTLVTPQLKADFQELKQEVALLALNEMMRGNFFSICAIDNAAGIMNIDSRAMRESEAYKLLSALHCFSWKVISPKIRDAIPGLIAEALSCELHIVQFTEIKPKTPLAERVTVPEPEVQDVTPKKSLVDRLLGR